MADETTATKKVKKLSKEIEGNILTITEATTGKALMFDFGDLPEDIQGKLGPFGLGHKLGDAAAGKSGSEAVEAIEKVWEGLKAGDWSVKAPAGEKVTLKALWDKISVLPEPARTATIEQMKSLGVDLTSFVEAEAAKAQA